MKFIKRNQVTLIITVVVILTIGITMTATGVTSRLALWNLFYDATNGRIRFVTETYDSTQSTIAYSELAIINSVADTTDNAIAISLTGEIDTTSAGVVINEDSNDKDFRVESNGSTAAIFVDAGNDRLGIFNTAPGVAVDVTGVVNLEGGNVIVNEDSGDYDFRVEGDTVTDTHLLFTDAANGRVEIASGITGGTPDVAFHLVRADTYTHVATNIAYFEYQSTGTPANGLATALGLRTETTAGNVETGAVIQATIDDVTSTSEDFALEFFTMTAGATATEKFSVGPTETVVNDPSADHDFRVESDTSTAAIFVDAGNNRVGIFNTAPGVALDVTGVVNLDGDNFNFNEDTGDYNFKIETDSTDNALLIDGGNDTLEINALTTTFNQGSADVDFTIESDDNASMFVVNGGDDRVAIGHATPDDIFHIESQTALTNTVDYVLRLAHDSSGTHANNIGVGIEFEQETGAANFELGVLIEAIAEDVTGAAEDFNIVFKTMTAGAAATEKFRIGSTETAVNEASADIDFRIEGDGNANMVFVDAGNDRVGIGHIAPDDLFHIESQTALTNTVDYVLRLAHDSSGTHANNIGVGIEFEQETAAANFELGVLIEAIAEDITGAAEDFIIVFKTMTAGAAATEKFRVGSTESVVNEGSVDHDFRVESDNQASMFHVEASSDEIGIAMSDPRHTFDVTGQIRQSDFYWEDEFCVVDAPQWTTNVTTGSVAIQALPGGAERLTTGGAITNEESLDWNDITTFVNTQRPAFEFQVDLEQVTVIEVGIGLKESEGVGVDDYIKIMLDISSQNTWYLEASTAGTPTTDQGAVADTDTHIFRVEWTSDTALEWFIDGVSQGTVASNVPTVALQPCIEVFTEENGAHYIDIYYYKIWQDRS